MVTLTQSSWYLRSTLDKLHILLRDVGSRSRRCVMTDECSRGAREEIINLKTRVLHTMQWLGRVSCTTANGEGTGRQATSVLSSTAVPQYAVRTAALVANADYVRPPNKYTFAGVWPAISCAIRLTNAIIYIYNLNVMCVGKSYTTKYKSYLILVRHWQSFFLWITLYIAV